MKKTIPIILLVALIAIQFFKPKPNQTTEPQPNDIVNAGTAPDDVAVILHKACYDCHSNNSKYPWYANVQPIAWWLDDHIQEGKDELNFSEFEQYSLKRKIKKFNEIAGEVTEGEMPLKSYLIVHKEALLGKEESNKLINWANLMATKLQQDSLTGALYKR